MAGAIEGSVRGGQSIVRPTLRELGIAVGRLPTGPTNSILDVPGTKLGHVSLQHGEGPLVVGQGPVRTGLSVIIPPGVGPWPAACHVINGYGKSLGLLQIQELGTLESPLFMTNTLAVGAVQQGYLEILRERGAFSPSQSFNVLVTECNDGYLNDLWGLHVRPEHVRDVLRDAESGGPLRQGSVGAGTGMGGFGHKGGIGTASRQMSTGAVIAAAVLVNCGRAEELRLDGAAVFGTLPRPHNLPDGSIIIALMTNAGFSSFDLGRLTRRATHGLARTGAISAPGSGDFVVAWDTGDADRRPGLEEAFLAVVESVEEAIWNALATAEGVDGRDGHRLEAVPTAAILGAARSRG